MGGMVVPESSGIVLSGDTPRTSQPQTSSHLTLLRITERWNGLLCHGLTFGVRSTVPLSLPKGTLGAHSR